MSLLVLAIGIAVIFFIVYIVVQMQSSGPAGSTENTKRVDHDNGHVANNLMMHSSSGHVGSRDDSHDSRHHGHHHHHDANCHHSDANSHGSSDVGGSSDGGGGGGDSGGGGGGD